MIGRHGIQRAHVVVRITPQHFGRRHVAGKQRHRADAIAVETEALGAGITDNHLAHLPGHVTDRKRIGVDICRKALVGHVDKRHKFAFDDDIGDRPPLGLARIQARGIVTASVQQNDVAVRHGAQRIEHCVDFEHMALGVIVGVRLEIQPGTAEQGDMIRPCRFAGPDGCVLSRPQDQARGDAQCA